MEVGPAWGKLGGIECCLFRALPAPPHTSQGSPSPFRPRFNYPRHVWPRGGIWRRALPQAAALGRTDEAPLPPFELAPVSFPFPRSSTGRGVVCAWWS